MWHMHHVCPYQDLNGGVRRVSEFFGFALSDNIIETIAEESTFRAMKESSRDSHGQMGNVFFRKGQSTFLFGFSLLLPQASCTIDHVMHVWVCIGHPMYCEWFGYSFISCCSLHWLYLVSELNYCITLIAPHVSRGFSCLFFTSAL